MKKIDNIENVFASERQDILDVLLRLENALSWDDLDAELRTIYATEILYLRRVVKHLDYLLDCCKPWPTASPDVSDTDMARKLNDGLDWPEIMTIESINNLPSDERNYYDYIRHCSRRWRLDQQR